MPRKRREPRRTLLHVMVERVGLRKSYKVALHVACWIIAEQYLEARPITVDEYAEWWKMSRAQAFRDQQAFRACFPEYTTPSDLWAILPNPPAVVRNESQMAARVMTTPA